MSTVVQTDSRTATNVHHDRPSNLEGLKPTQSEDVQRLPAAPHPDIEALQSDDAMAAVMVTGILSLAFVTLVVLMSFVCWWTFAAVGSQ